MIPSDDDPNVTEPLPDDDSRPVATVDASVPLSEHGAIRGANSHRYPLTRREHWRAMDIDQHRALEREAHKMALATKAEQVAVASRALVALLGE